MKGTLVNKKMKNEIRFIKITKVLKNCHQIQNRKFMKKIKHNNSMLKKIKMKET